VQKNNIFPFIYFYFSSLTTAYNKIGTGGAKASKKSIIRHRNTDYTYSAYFIVCTDWPLGGGLALWSIFMQALVTFLAFPFLYAGTV
jgi:hypothetical protein